MRSAGKRVVVWGVMAIGAATIACLAIAMVILRTR